MTRILHELIQLIVMSVITVIEFLLLYYVAKNFLSLPAGFILHLVVIVLSALALTKLRIKMFNKRSSWIFLTIALFLGPLGCMMVTLSFIGYLLLRIIEKEQKNPLKHLMPEENETESQRLFERVIYGQDVYNPEKLPLIYHDVLAFGTEKQKREVIERMLRHFRSEFSLLLKQALNDQANSIRVIAATAVTRIDKQYDDDCKKLEKKYQRDPKNLHSILTLAKQCQEYASLEFIDIERQKKLNNRALELFQEGQKIAPEDINIATVIAEYHIQQKEYKEAFAILNPFMEKSVEIGISALKCYLSSLFLLKEYEEIRSLCKKYQLDIFDNPLELDTMLYLLVLWKRGTKEVLNVHS